MRSGRLLAEESPRALLTMFNCTSLEEAFLKLSRQEGQNSQPPAELNITNNISLVRKTRSYVTKILFMISPKLFAIRKKILYFLKQRPSNFTELIKEQRINLDHVFAGISELGQEERAGVRDGRVRRRWLKLPPK